MNSEPLCCKLVECICCGSECRENQIKTKRQAVPHSLYPGTLCNMKLVTSWHAYTSHVKLYVLCSFIFNVFTHGLEQQVNKEYGIVGNI